jgi:hypothetical protein
MSPTRLTALKGESPVYYLIQKLGTSNIKQIIYCSRCYIGTESPPPILFVISLDALSEVMKETPRKRTTVTSSFIEISMDQL